MAIEEKEKIDNEELNKNVQKNEETDSLKKEESSEKAINENKSDNLKSAKKSKKKKNEKKKNEEKEQNKAQEKETAPVSNSVNEKQVNSQDEDKSAIQAESKPVSQDKSAQDSDSKKETKNVSENTESNESKFKQTEIKSHAKHIVIKICENIFFTLIAIIVIAFTIFTIVNTDNSIISSGISILGVDVSGLDKTAATDKISNHIQETLENNDIILKHNEFETNIGPEQIETKINVSSAIDAAFDIGSGSNIFNNSFKKLSLLIKNVDIQPTLSINNEQLNTTLSDISTQLPDAVKQSDYYIDGNNLIVTSGKSGVVINNEEMIKNINSKLSDLSYINAPIEIETINKDPEPINIDNIYNEIHKEAVDAHFDSATHIVYPEENGLDFSISLDEAKQLLVSEKKEEYSIPLKTLKPNVTTNMIGMEAFPHLLSSFSTRYPASNRDRTTNLKLAASKVNGTVVLPGQTFSYNSVVGQRTIAAGYKEAAVYQDGEVVQGLGGGICQISTTLYNAALYANLDIVERRNHQFVPSYIGAGRDATVVYGSQDFRFKNNRNYAIKITCSVDKGVATFNIHGLKEDSDCEVVISSNITSRGANSFTSATYKTLKRGGQVISSSTISRDTYKVHH